MDDVPQTKQDRQALRAELAAKIERSKKRRLWPYGVAFVLLGYLASTQAGVWNARRNAVVKVAIARAEQNPQVAAALGTPLEIVWGWYIPSHEHSHVFGYFPVRGPRASGRLYVRGDQTSAGPTLERVYLTAPTGETIDIVGTAPAPKH